MYHINLAPWPYNPLFTIASCAEGLNGKIPTSSLSKWKKKIDHSQSTDFPRLPATPPAFLPSLRFCTPCSPRRGHRVALCLPFAFCRRRGRATRSSGGGLPMVSNGEGREHARDLAQDEARHPRSRLHTSYPQNPSASTNQRTPDLLEGMGDGHLARLSRAPQKMRAFIFFAQSSSSSNAHYFTQNAYYITGTTIRR